MLARVEISKLVGELKKRDDLFTFSFVINKDKPWQRSINGNPGWKKVRKIECYSKDINKILKGINDLLLYQADKDLHEHQYGFRTERGTMELVQMQGSKAICLDLESAFHNIKRKRAFRILNRYMCESDARFLAKTLTPHGYMFQGHPIAPLILNLALVEALKDIGNIFPNLKGFHYADDLNFFYEGNLDKETVYAMVSKIRHILRSQGFKVNKKKTHVFSSNVMFTLGLVKEYRVGFKSAKYVIVGRRRLKKKVRMFAHWLEKKRENTQRKDKLGNKISTRMVMMGICQYLEDVRKANKNPRTFRIIRNTLEVRFLKLTKSTLALSGGSLNS